MLKFTILFNVLRTQSYCGLEETTIREFSAAAEIGEIEIGFGTVCTSGKNRVYFHRNERDLFVIICDHYDYPRSEP
ncbi:MAG: hypothetical protein AB2L20_07355 [Mangrovibacterium sp.]